MTINSDEEQGSNQMESKAVDPKKETITDGRKSRREQNKRKVLSTFLNLIAEKRTLPDTGEIASEAGVSRRSIFRYFNDLDELIEEAYHYKLDQIREKFPEPEVPIKTDNIEEVITRYVNHLSDIYEFTASIRNLLSERGMPLEVRERIETLKSQTLRDGLKKYFEIFLDDTDIESNFIYALESSLSPKAWDYLKGPCGLNIEQARQAWVEMLLRIFSKYKNK